MRTIIKNGTVCFEDKTEQTHLFIENGIIKDWGLFDAQADQIIDARGCYVCPGFIDMHVHLDDQIGPYYLADDYGSGSQIAIQNGITTLFNFITQKQGETLLAAIHKAEKKAVGNTYTAIGFHLTPTVFDEAAWEEINFVVNKGFHNFKFYTTYRNAGIYSDYTDIDRFMRRLNRPDIQYLIHCEDDSSLNPFTPSGAEIIQAYSHARLRPKSAEITAIGKMIEIARVNRSKIHIVHTTTPEGVEMIYHSKATAAVTCETAPHYLFLNDTWLQRDDGYKWICSPPLRPESDRQKLVQQALENKIDVFSTDHCAFIKKDKSNNCTDIRQVPNGIAGIGALIPLIFSLYKDKLNNTNIIQVVHGLSTNPAKITGCYPKKGIITKGADADITILQINGPERPIQSSLRDVYETYEDHTTNLQIKHVLLHGTAVVNHNHLIEGIKPQGKLLCTSR